MKMFVLWRLGRIQIYKYDNPSEQKVRFTIDLVRTLQNSSWHIIRSQLKFTSIKPHQIYGKKQLHQLTSILTSAFL